MASKEASIILDELEKTFDAVSDTQIDALIDKVNAHQRIFVYATGRSGLMVKTFAMRLMQMGRTAFVVGETTTPSIQPGDLLVLASSSGTTKSVCDYADSAAKSGIDLAIITSDAESYLSSNFDVTVSVRADSKNSSGGNSIQPMGSLFEQALLVVFDAAILKMSQGGDTAQRMRSNHANLE
ncbi:MAG: SIS domain-containing protein [Oscillospiraceae bacterium]|nr:SIS domain-containing protein [Oscillospiraceae bacterium]